MANKRDTRRVENVIARLEALCNPENPMCGVDPETKRKVAPYVATWIIPVLQEILNNEPERPW